VCAALNEVWFLRGLPGAHVTLREFRDQIDRIQWSSAGGKIFAVGMTAAFVGPRDIHYLEAHELIRWLQDMDQYFWELEKREHV